MSLRAALVDLVFPASCVGCRTAGPPLCAQCLPCGPPVRPPVLPRLPVLAAGSYADALRAALLAYKERGRGDLAAPLGGLLAGALGHLLEQVRAVPEMRVVVVAIPSSRGVRGARGGDPLARLAGRAARAQGLRRAVDALWVARPVQDSAGLGRAERRRNLDHAYLARPAPPGTAAVLVDDIVTSGATLREATRALTARGWPVLGAAVVAATPPPTRCRPPRAALADPVAGAQRHAGHWQVPGSRSSVSMT